jgi:death-on-curing protein
VRLLSVAEVTEIHLRLIAQSGGASGLRDAGALASSVAQPSQSFSGEELYSGLIQKAAAVAFFLASNHPFVDGNKRVAHAAMAVTLLLNGYAIQASIEDQEEVILSLAAGQLSREQFTNWVEQHAQRLGA